jgi:cytosine/adenosine deaminase-related metal-dependent hydrolase
MDIDSLRRDFARASALEQGAEQHPRQVVIYREIRNMSDEHADQFAERMKALLEEFEKFENDEAGEGSHTRALTVAYYPSFYYDEQESGED